MGVSSQHHDPAALSPRGKYHQYLLDKGLVGAHSLELIQTGRGTLHSEIHKLIMLIWNKEELPYQWKESIVVPIHKKGDKTDCSNYRGISLLSKSYKILPNILLSRLISYADEIIGDHQCGFQRNRSETDQIFCIHQIL
jgi:hypothetical protein